MTQSHETEDVVGDGRREFSPGYCRAARALLNWPQVRLGAKSNLSEATIRDFESGRRILRPERIDAVRKAFESAGITFTVEGPLLAPTPAGPSLPEKGDPLAEEATGDKGSAKRAPKRARSRPLRGEDLEVKHVVETHDISAAQARELVRRHGNEGRKIDEAAKIYRNQKSE